MEGDGFFEGDGVEGEVKSEFLFADTVRVAAIGELPDFVLWDGVGLHLHSLIGASEFRAGFVGEGFVGGDRLPLAGFCGGVLAHARRAIGSRLGLQKDAGGEQGKDARSVTVELGYFNQ